jgi:hypothetical protein
MSEKIVADIIDSFFFKKRTKTPHESLANYSDGTLVAGGEKGEFYTHICYHTIKQSLLELIKNNKESYTIVETGCAAHGTQSTLLWDRFVNNFQGTLRSVDLNKKAVDFTNTKLSEKSKVICSDSLLYLPTLESEIDFLYLDSYDVDFLDPLLSAEHHLKEFNLVKHLLHKGSVILIDDTPKCVDWLDNGKHNRLYNKLKNNFNPEMCGKGSLVNKELEIMGATKIMNQYQVLWVL